MLRSILLISALSVLVTMVQAGNILYSQCGGTDFTGKTACPVNSKCALVNDYYSQCLPVPPPPPPPPPITTLTSTTPHQTTTSRQGPYPNCYTRTDIGASYYTTTITRTTYVTGGTEVVRENTLKARTTIAACASFTVTSVVTATITPAVVA